MRIEHLAVWTSDLERMRGFYEHFFGAEAGDKYVNAAKQFESYFLSFESGAHLALSVGSREAVDSLPPC